MIDHISIQRQGEMADAVKHAIVAMICAKHLSLSLFFTVLVLEFKSNSKWDDEDHHHHHEATNAILTFQCHQKGEPDKEKKQTAKVTLLLRCVIGVLPTASFASPALR
jgi:hypothetical protein